MSKQSMLRLLLLLLVTTGSLVACGTLGDLTEPEFIIPATTSAKDLVPEGPTPTRRPAPTPLPTEELAGPRSESPEPEATAVELSSEEQADMGLQSIQSARLAGLTVNAVRATMTAVNLTSGERDTILLEFVRPDSFRMVTEELELIVAAGNTFIMDKTANWLVSPGEQTERFGTLFDPFTDIQFVEAQLETLASNSQDIQFVGEEELNGNTTRVFTFSEPIVDDQAPVTTTVWIGAEDGLLYQQVITFTSNGENHENSTAFGYGDSIHIEPPVP